MSRNYISYTVACATKNNLEAALKAAAGNFPTGTGTGAMGLTPDHIKQSIEYRSARAKYNQAHDALAYFNRFFCRHFKREIAADRAAARRTAA